jgi:pyruvate dehydrogenase E1 component alpha subunit
MAKSAKTQTKTKPAKRAKGARTWSIPELVQILKEDGTLTEKGLEPQLSDGELREIYGWMVRGRVFDERALALQRQGRLGTYAPLSGQEAAQTGSAWALKPEDWLFPSYREHLAQALRGQSWVEILTYWGGNEDGNRIPDGVNNFTISIPIATQLLHATGLAWAAKMRGEPIAAIVYFGDGGTSEGDFHEALNFAGVFQAPVVFFCQNNQYAISVPRERQTRSETIAQKAIAYGFEGIQIDGNDVLAVYRTTSEAIEKARSGGGPTLIEAVTYRFGHHTTADDWTRYRPKEEVEEWRRRDPLLRMRKYLESKGLWSDAEEEKLWEEAKAEIAKAVEEYERMPERDVEEIFKYMYAEMPWHLQEELEDLRAYLREREQFEEE